MYKAIYRRWRSPTFDDLKGQEQVSKVLKRQCETGNYAHAYLFCGTRGTGKTSTAKILAKAVNCLDLKNGNPCCACSSCLDIDNGVATDVVELDAASNNSVNDIRDLCDELIYPPTSLNKRVYIIDEAHMLSTEADNALLKTLEEPPPHVIFILATTELNKIPPTIMSRCQRFEFRRIDETEIIKHIKNIVEKENIILEDQAAELLARLADGSMRDALNLLESCIAASDIINIKTVSELLGLSNGEVIINFFRAFALNDTAAVISLLNEYYNSARSLSSLFNELLLYIRNALYYPFTKNEKIIGSQEISKNIPPEKLLYIAGIIEETLIKFTKINIDKKIIAELALYKICDSRFSDSNEALLTRIEVLEKKFSGTINYVQSTEIPQKNPIIKESEKPQISNETMYERTAELAEQLPEDGVLKSQVVASKIIVSGNIMTIKTNPFGEGILSKPENIEQIKTALHALDNIEYIVEIKNEAVKIQQSSLINEL